MPLLAVNAQEEDDLDEQEDIEQLSPFVVEGTDTDGYTATSTLGGTRIRTDLRDLSTPLSVSTKQFLQDTNSQSNLDLLNYTTNTEVGGLFGNYGGFGNSQGVSDRGALLQPNNNTRVRGLEAADNTRNFFLSDIPWDSYNVDRVEIQRGPNSILFGVGSPAGIINTNTVVSHMGGNEGSLEWGHDRFGSNRYVADYNYVIMEDLWSVRFSGLYNDRQFRQEPAFNNDKRLFGTTTIQPQVLPESWASRLTVRASFETAGISANNPRMLPPEDGITLWFEDTAGDGVNDRIGLGQGIFDTFLYNQTGGGDPNRGPLSDSGVLNPFYQPGTAAIDSGALNNGGVGFFFVNGQEQPYFVSRQAPRVYPGALAADGSIDNAIDIPFGSLLRAGGMNAYAVQVDRMDTTEGMASRFPLATRGYYKDQSLTDASIFDFYNNLVDGNNKREKQDWDAVNISLSQTFFDNRIGLEYVWDKQYYKQWREGATWNRPYISIDINANLQNQLSQYTRVPDPNDPTAELIDPSTYSVYGFTPTPGQPYANPNAGAAFMAGSFSNNNILERDRETHRVTAFGELNFSDFMDDDSWLTKMLGRHVFTGLYTKESRDENVTNYAPSQTSFEWANNLSVSGENTLLGESTRGITPVIYLSEPLFGVSSASGLNLSANNTIYAPVGSYTADFFQTTWLPSTDPMDPTYVDPGAPWTNLLGDPTGVQADNPFNYTGRTNGTLTVLNAQAGDLDQLILDYGVTEQTINSVGLVWQGHFFGGTIVPTFGWRRDELETYTGSGAKDATGVASRSGVITTKVLENKGETISWGIVGHVPSDWVRNVPIISGLSAYYNVGENTKVEARFNYDGSPLANPSAESVDYGVVLSAFENKLTLKVGRYKTEVKNGNLPGGGSILGANQYYLYQLEAWGTANSLLNIFGSEGLDPNQDWHWNWAMVDDNEWGNSDYDPGEPTYENHPSTASQRAAVDAWITQMDADFFVNYEIPADVSAIQSAYQTYQSTGDVQPLVDAAAASGFQVGTYTTGFSSQNDGQIDGIRPNGTIDNTSEGWEIEMNYQPTPNWNIQVNASKTDAYRENLGQPMLDWIDYQWSKLQGPAGDLRLWWGGDRTIRQYYEDNIISAVQFQQESVGFQAPELRPWRFAAITNYRFTEGFLRGFNSGGSIRFQDRQILGYGLKDDLSGLSVEKPLYGENDLFVDLWFGYDYRINDNLDWRIQLNLRNVGKDTGLTPISANPDGTHAAYRITEGMSWTVTNTLKF